MAKALAASPHGNKKIRSVCGWRVSHARGAHPLDIFSPAPHPLTNNEVNTTVAQALASATPPPAYSEQVFQVIQPSLVLIQTKITEGSGNAEDSLGSGVVIDAGGDVLTALHVVVNSSSIQLTFADETQARGKITNKQPQDDIAVVQPDQLPGLLVPAVRAIARHPRWRRSVRGWQSLRLIQFNERGRHLRF